MGEGEWGVSSPTIPTPNQSLFISFSLPFNVIHNKFLLKRFYVPVNFKLHLTKTEMAFEVQGALKREMVYTNHGLSTKSLF